MTHSVYEYVSRTPAVQGSVLGVAGNTETGACWPLSKAHNPSGIVPGIEVRVRRTERAAWRQEAASRGERRGCIYLCRFRIFSIPFTVCKYRKGAKLWPFSPSSASSLHSQTMLGTWRAQLKVRVCSICSVLPSLLGSRREHSQYGGKQNQEGFLPFFGPRALSS